MSEFNNNHSELKNEDNLNPPGKDSNKISKAVRIRRAAYFLSSLLFVMVMTAAFGISFDFFDRPSFSESEKRQLAEFPKLTASALFSGTYFDDIDLWFSDTFPFRDTLVAASTKIKSAIGIGQSVYNFSEGSADEIPEAEEESQEYVDIDPVVPNTEPGSDLYKPALPSGGSSETTTSSQNEGKDVLEQKFDAIYIYGDTAYEYYNFVQSTADKYISAVNSAAASASAQGINVYNMIIPTSIDITLNEKTRSKLNSSDQQDAINYMYSKMNDNVKTVALFDLLKAHKDEYIYFRTDHHWTSLGAYYAYAQFMTVKGGKYEPLSNFTQYSFDNFLGSFYNDTGKNEALSKAPDTVYAYMPKYNVSFKMKENNSSDYINWPLICDASSYQSSYKYLCFIGGDNPISVIENKDMTEGETCVLVKESFGNAFAPYLACNYKYVYVVDYRYFNRDITDFAKEVNAKDIIIQNNTSMTRNASLVKKLGEIL